MDSYLSIFYLVHLKSNLFRYFGKDLVGLFKVKSNLLWSFVHDTFWITLNNHNILKCFFLLLNILSDWKNDLKTRIRLIFLERMPTSRISQPLFLHLMISVGLWLDDTMTRSLGNGWLTFTLSNQTHIFFLRELITCNLKINCVKNKCSNLNFILRIQWL